MKDQTNIWEWRDISGTGCVSRAYLAYLTCTSFIAYLVRIWLLFFTHVAYVVIKNFFLDTKLDNKKINQMVNSSAYW